MMPDLPNVGLERDIEQFIEFFENPAFRPDGLKLYPTLGNFFLEITHAYILNVLLVFVS